MSSPQIALDDRNESLHKYSNSATLTPSSSKPPTQSSTMSRTRSTGSRNGQQQFPIPIIVAPPAESTNTKKISARSGSKNLEDDPSFEESGADDSSASSALPGVAKGRKNFARELSSLRSPLYEVSAVADVDSPRSSRASISNTKTALTSSIPANTFFGDSAQSSDADSDSPPASASGRRRPRARKRSKGDEDFDPSPSRSASPPRKISPLSNHAELHTPEKLNHLLGSEGDSIYSSSPEKLSTLTMNRAKIDRKGKKRASDEDSDDALQLPEDYDDDDDTQLSDDSPSPKKSRTSTPNSKLSAKQARLKNLAAANAKRTRDAQLRRAAAAAAAASGEVYSPPKPSVLGNADEFGDQGQTGSRQASVFSEADYLQVPGAISSRNASPLPDFTRSPSPTSDTSVIKKKRGRPPGRGRVRSAFGSPASRKWDLNDKKLLGDPIRQKFVATINYEQDLIEEGTHPLMIQLKDRLEAERRQRLATAAKTLAMREIEIGTMFLGEERRYWKQWEDGKRSLRTELINNIHWKDRQLQSEWYDISVAADPALVSMVNPSVAHQAPPITLPFIEPLKDIHTGQMRSHPTTVDARFAQHSAWSLDAAQVEADLLLLGIMRPLGRKPEGGFPTQQRRGSMPGSIGPITSQPSANMPSRAEFSI